MRSRELECGDAFGEDDDLGNDVERGILGDDCNSDDVGVRGLALVLHLEVPVACLTDS